MYKLVWKFKYPWHWWALSNILLINIIVWSAILPGLPHTLLVWIIISSVAALIVVEVSGSYGIINYQLYPGYTYQVSEYAGDKWEYEVFYKGASIQKGRYVDNRVRHDDWFNRDNAGYAAMKCSDVAWRHKVSNRAPKKFVASHEKPQGDGSKCSCGRLAKPNDYLCKRCIRAKKRARLLRR